MYVTNNDIGKFADEKVNLKSEQAKKYREQVEELSSRIKMQVEKNPDFHFKRAMLSGSLAKRTSLRSISDADMALYIKTDGAPKDMLDFLGWLADELAKLYPQKDRSDITPKNYSVSINFRGTGLDVDVVPICWYNNEWDGDLVSQDDGSLLRTNIPQHIEFMKKRHKSRPNDFRQVVRLLKYWANEQKEANEDFRFKSFMIELIVAHLTDRGKLSFGDLPAALREFFDYLHMSGLNEVISFDDFGQGNVQKQGKPINIFDPVNRKNNVADKYTENNKKLILDAALDAADAIAYASYATTKEEAVRQWRKVFGTTFSL